MATQPLLLVEEVADLCSVTASTVRRWLVDDDPLPSQLLGTLRRVVLPAALVEWAGRRGMMLSDDPHAVARPWPRLEPAQDGGSAA